jgi:uncharacterized membrane protein YeaQ/YmgE (transglycosylase-associated protein family)
VILYIILVILSGFIVGGLARFALPGKDPMTFFQTVAVGVGGNLAAGLVTWAIFGRNYGGFLLSLVFAMGIVYLVRRSRGGSLTDPGTRPGIDRR